MLFSLAVIARIERNDTQELNRVRSVTSSNVATFAGLWRDAHQLTFTTASDAFVRGFDPAPHFSTAAMAPEEFTTLPRSKAKYGKCKSFRGSTACTIEWDEWVMSTALLTPAHTILELGARYGTTSCVLARATNNSGGVVSVEPDSSVYNDLLYNRDAHHCNFHVVMGTMGPSRQKVNPRLMNGYGRTTLRARQDEMATDAFNYRSIERRIGRRFNAALVDCEGCIFSLLQTDLLEQLELVLMEEDGEGITPSSYAPVHARLRELGYARVWQSHDTFDPKAKWSQTLVHSAWARDVQAASSTQSKQPAGNKATRPETNDLCKEAMRRNGYSHDQLNCF